MAMLKSVCGLTQTHCTVMSVIGMLLFSDYLFATKSEVTVFAAASLETALTEVLPKDHEPPVSFSFASSSTLARQISHGAPADIFVSANRTWMDYLQREGHIDTTTRVDMLANRLVIIAPAGSSFSEKPNWEWDLSSTIDGYLAIGDPGHVPAGMYAKQAFIKLGWWPGLAPRLVAAPSVRAALLFVARGECSAGVVYATDAMVSDEVEIVTTLPENLHDPIRYSVAITANTEAYNVRTVMDRLLSPVATEIFNSHGFIVLEREEKDAESFVE